MESCVAHYDATALIEATPTYPTTLTVSIDWTAECMCSSRTLLTPLVTQVDCIWYLEMDKYKKPCMRTRGGKDCIGADHGSEAWSLDGEVITRWAEKTFGQVIEGDGFWFDVFAPYSGTGGGLWCGEGKPEGSTLRSAFEANAGRRSSTAGAHSHFHYHGSGRNRRGHGGRGDRGTVVDGHRHDAAGHGGKWWHPWWFPHHHTPGNAGLSLQDDFQSSFVPQGGPGGIDPEGVGPTQKGAREWRAFLTELVVDGLNLIIDQSDVKCRDIVTEEEDSLTVDLKTGRILPPR